MLAMRGVAEAPFASPIASGAVQLEWELGDRYLELELTGDAINLFRRHADTELSEHAITRSRAVALVDWFMGER